MQIAEQTGATRVASESAFDLLWSLSEDNRMPKTVSVRIPHDLGKEEARRRIEEGFGQLRQQMGGGLLGMVKFDDRWVGDQLQFSGGTLGQVVTGRVDVGADA